MRKTINIQDIKSINYDDSIIELMMDNSTETLEITTRINPMVIDANFNELEDRLNKLEDQLNESR